jgi:hypothetical protein
LNFASRKATLNPKREEKNFTQRRNAKVKTEIGIAAKMCKEHKDPKIADFAGNLFVSLEQQMSNRPDCPARLALSSFLELFRGDSVFCLNLGVFAPLREI